MKLLLLFTGTALLITIGIYVFTQQNAALPTTNTEFPDANKQPDVSVQRILLTRSGEVLPITLPQDDFESLTDEGSFMTDFSGQGFDILYYAPEGALTVLLLEEPLGDSRTAAEDYIMSTFNIPATELCDLNAG